MNELALWEPFKPVNLFDVMIPAFAGTVSRPAAWQAPRMDVWESDKAAARAQLRQAVARDRAS